MFNYGNDNHDLLWSGVSGEHEVVQKQASFVHAKVAAAQYWPFLSRAVSEADFENRLALAQDRIAARVGDQLSEVLDSFREDFRALAGKGENPFAKDDDSDDDKSDDKDSKDSKKSDKKKSKDDDDSDDDYSDDSDSDDDSDNKGENKSGEDKEDDASDDDNKPDFLKGKKATVVDVVPAAPAHNAYTPDPNRGWRYHPGYEGLGAPVNNGDSQGPDGFPVNLADGEARSNTVIEDRQLTPGTWTQHDGMPERPMPFSQQRGYMPVNASFDAQGFLVEATNPYIKQQGGQWVIVQKGTGKVLSHHDSREKAEESFSAMEMNKHSKLTFDAQGFVIEANQYIKPQLSPIIAFEPRSRAEALEQQAHSMGFHHGESDAKGGYPSNVEDRLRFGPDAANFNEVQADAYRRAYTFAHNQVNNLRRNRFASAGRGVDPLQDPVPGQPQRHNPFYFQEGSNLGGNTGFPVDPSAEPLPNNLDAIYGDVPPVSSSGSAEGQVDGQGYSRLNSSASLRFDAQGYLVESPNFT